MSVFVYLWTFLIHVAWRSPYQTSVVDLGYAKYQGILNASSNITHFVGIRFAAPPVAQLRFAAPQEPPTVSGVQLAVNFPPRCLSGAMGRAPSYVPIAERLYQNPAVAEDCLFLNVHVPGEPAQGQDLPVLVWIHGGGYVSGGVPDTDSGDDLIRASKHGAIVVLIQYRLGLFGFLAGEEVKKGGALNSGLLDQQFALRWVQNHIHKFGGDPNKVTIWGKSAGAGSILQHVIANDGKTTPPLFRAAMTSSTFLPSQYSYNDPISEMLYNKVVKEAGCSSSQDTLHCLRTVDSSALDHANVEVGQSGFYGTFVFVPVVDGSLITERPTQLLNQGKVNTQAVYAVTNTFEGLPFFVDQSKASTVNTAQYLKDLFPHMTGEKIREGVKAYESVGTPIDQAIAVMSEAIFTCPTYFLLRGTQGPKFKAEFAILPAGHVTDSPYLFPSTGAPPFRNADFEKAFSESFFSFVKDLHPNPKPTLMGEFGPITPPWSAWDETGRHEMLFNKTETDQPDVRAIATDDALYRRCMFWESVGAETGQ